MYKNKRNKIPYDEEGVTQKVSDFKKRRKMLMNEIYHNWGDFLIIHNTFDHDYVKERYFPHPIMRWLNLPKNLTFTLIIMIKNKNGKFKISSKLWIDLQDDIDKIWHGQIFQNIEDAKEKFEINNIYIFNKEEEDKIKQKLIKHKDKKWFYLNISKKPDEHSGFEKFIRSFEPIILNPGRNLFTPTDIIDKLRVVKSPSEIKLIEEACQISANAHIKVLLNIKPGISENQLSNIFVSEILLNNCQKTAYPNIIGSGYNSTILHHHPTNKILEDGDMLLIDAGAEYEGYASDISRTYPVSGMFTPEQTKIYNLVFDIQQQLINNCKPGFNWNKLQALTILLISKGLCELGLIKSSFQDCIKQETFLNFYMHGIGHWIGLDVHDCQSIPTTFNMDTDTDSNLDSNLDTKLLETPFIPGMTITIEPGIYIGNHLKSLNDPNLDQNVLEKYLNIGVRIEDVILITDQEPEILSKGIPKTIQEIEHFMNG
tara:strand:+ start:10306 stop:11760 length:1455 start_codon:yes stop_codon:yes gene_type:complete